MRLGAINRVVIAGLAAPLSVLVFVPAVDLSLAIVTGESGLLQRAWYLPLLMLPYAYVLTLVVGIPTYLLLRRWNFVPIWTGAAAGFLAVWVVPIVIALAFAGHDPHPRVTYWTYALQILKHAPVTIPVALVGMAVGVVFWAIAKPPRDSATISN